MKTNDGIHYETQGKGPALLLIPGGNGDGRPFGPIASLLAGRFTVVTLDRRGYSQSAEVAIPSNRLAADVADVRSVITAVGGHVAVFGSSSGAIVGLELMRHAPALVNTLVAHEPPLTALLTEAADWRKTLEGVVATYRAEGVDAAMRTFSEAVFGDGEFRPREGAALANAKRWLEHELVQYACMPFDADALSPHAGKILVGVGKDVPNAMPYRTAIETAKAIGCELIDFPGGHIGFVTHAEEFAATLVSALR